MRRSLLVLIAVFAAGCGGAGGDEPMPPGGTAAGDDRLLVSRAGWKTDFARHSVPLSEFVPGGPPRDGIPPLDAPKTESVLVRAGRVPTGRSDRRGLSAA